MAERKTPWRDGAQVVVPVAASTKVEAGKFGAVNAAGYLREAADAAGLTVIGRIDETVDNTAGSNGDLSAPVRRKAAFFLANDGTNPVTQALMGKSVYVKDSQTVSASGGTNSIVAGTCLGLESGGVWVEPA